jgi:hypothetical protein
MDKATFQREIGADPAEPRRERWLQRAGWVLFGVPLAAAAAGLLGAGPLAIVTASDPAGRFTVRYEWIERYNAPVELRVEMLRPAGDTVELWIERRFLDQVQIESIEPAPLREQATAERRTFTLAAGGDGPVRLAVFYRHRHPLSRHNFRLGLGDGDTAVHLRQFVLP